MRTDNSVLKNWQFWFAIIGAVSFGFMTFSDISIRLTAQEIKMDQMQKDVTMINRKIDLFVDHKDVTRLSFNHLDFNTTLLDN